MPIDKTYLDERIAATKTLIEAIETAIETVSGGAQHYTLDTGATRQVVTKVDLASLENRHARLLNRLSTLCARRNGASPHILPGF